MKSRIILISLFIMVITLIGWPDRVFAYTSEYVEGPDYHPTNADVDAVFNGTKDESEGVVMASGYICLKAGNYYFDEDFTFSSSPISKWVYLLGDGDYSFNGSGTISGSVNLLQNAFSGSSSQVTYEGINLYVNNINGKNLKIEKGCKNLHINGGTFEKDPDDDYEKCFIATNFGYVVADGITCNGPAEFRSIYKNTLEPPKILTIKNSTFNGTLTLYSDGGNFELNNSNVTANDTAVELTRGSGTVGSNTLDVFDCSIESTGGSAFYNKNYTNCYITLYDGTYKSDTELFKKDHNGEIKIARGRLYNNKWGHVFAEGGTSEEDATERVNQYLRDGSYYSDPIIITGTTAEGFIATAKGSQNNYVDVLKKKYTVKFKSNGTIIESLTKIVEKGEKIDRPETPVRKGWKLLGWFKGDTLQNEWDFSNDTISENCTLHAKWEEAPTVPTSSLPSGTYTKTQTVRLTTDIENAKIYYSVNNGEYTLYKNPISIDSAITIAAYVDLNGYLSETINLEYIIENANNKYNIIVESENGGAAYPSNTIARAGDSIKLFEDANDGYEFDKWVVLTENVYIVNNSFIMPSEDVRIKVVFKENDNPKPKEDDDKNKDYDNKSGDSNDDNNKQDWEKHSHSYDGDASDNSAINTNAPKAALPVNTVILTDFNSNLPISMIVLAQDKITEANQLWLVDYFSRINKKSKAILASFNIYVSRDLSVTENGSTKILTWKNLPANQAGKIYAQCFNETDGAYVIEGYLDNKGVGVFYDFIMRPATSITVFTLK